MNIDAYIVLRFVVIFQNFLSFLCSVLHVSPETDLRRRDRSVSVPVESAAETATLNYDMIYIHKERADTKIETLIHILGCSVVVYFMRCWSMEHSKNYSKSALLLGHSHT